VKKEKKRKNKKEKNSLKNTGERTRDKPNVFSGNIKKKKNKIVERIKQRTS